MFMGWLGGINMKLKAKIIVGASAMCWAIWLTRNNIVFDKFGSFSLFFRSKLCVYDYVVVICLWCNNE
jgi:hypothetical protein